MSNFIKPNTETISSAGKFVSEATAKQQSGDLAGALKGFNSAASILKSELDRCSIESRIYDMKIEPGQHQFILQYLQQLDAQKKALEEALEKEVSEKMKEAREKRKELQQQQKETASSSAPSSASTSKPQTPSAKNASDLFGGVSIPSHKLDGLKKNTSAVPHQQKPTSASSVPSSPSSSSSSSAPPPSQQQQQPSLNKPSFSASLTGGAAASSSSRPSGNTSSSSSGYAPRASDIVYKAIEHATKLAASHQYKTAADIVQHAYEVGCREDHRPKNLEKLPILARELRAKFQGQFKRSIPQDNERTEEEIDVLRASGKTTRMLLSEWDDLDEGYSAENIWMPGKTDQAFQDDFIPRMAPDQMKWKPRYLRFHDIMSYCDKFDVLTGKVKPQQQQDDKNEKDEKQEENKSDDVGVEEQKQQQQQLTQSPHVTPISILSSLPNPMTIKQTVVSDCSLVCSLIVTANFERTFSHQLIRSAIFPKDDAGREPIINRKGKYCIKMLLNGTVRVITVDDRFPASHCEEIESGATTIKQPELLCSYTTTRGEMWVSLMEKAFIKVSGGSYDFPGSNSSNDLYRLSGWLPDTLRFPNTGQRYGANFDHEDAADSKEKPFDADFQWRRLSTCHARGAVVMTISTPSELPKVVEERLKLIPGHAYAVLEFKQVSAGYRLVKVKNPWSSQPWEGLFGIEDTRRCTPEMLQELNHTKDESDQGVFWMTWQDVTKFFAVAHLSWNPFALYPPPQHQKQKYFVPTRLARHAKNISTTTGGGEAPQFQILIPPSAASTSKRRMHMVLSRHITDDSEYEENEVINSTTHQNNNTAGSSKKVEAPFITVHIYDTTNLPSLAAQCRAMQQDSDMWRARRASLTGTTVGGGRRLKTSFETGLVPCLHRGVYSNAPATTHSFDCPAGARELTCVVARLPQHKHNSGTSSSTTGSYEPFSFSITLYSNIPYNKENNSNSNVGFDFLPMPPLKPSLRHRCVVPGEWISGQNCGGPPGGQTFTFNPQYTFILNQDSHILAELLSPVDCAVNVVICKVKDENVAWFDNPNNASINNPAWCIRADHLTSQKYSFALCAPIASKFGSSVDSSLADCVAIGDKSRQPDVQPNQPQQSTSIEETTDPTKLPQQPKKFTSIHQLLHSLSLDIKIPTAHGPTSLLSIPLKENLSLANAIANCPLSTWLISLMLSKGQLCSSPSSSSSSNDPQQPQSKCICGGSQLNWISPMNQSYMNEASAQTSSSTLTLIIITGTDSLPRTNSLINIEKELSSIANNIIELLKIHLSEVEKDPAKFSQSILGLNEAVEKQILALDGDQSCTTEDIKKARSTLVRAAQELHKLLDFAAKNRPPAYIQQEASASSSSNNNNNNIQSESSIQQKPNPLRSTLTIPAGRYVLIASTQEKGKPGLFSVSLECEEEPVELRPLPAEGTGWKCPNPNLTSIWSGASAAGPPQGEQGWQTYKKNPTISITVRGNARDNKTTSAQNKIRLFCRLLALPPPGSSSSIRNPAMQLMMFKNSVSSENVVAVSGRYAIDGVVLKTGMSGDNDNDNDEDNKNVFGVCLEYGSEYFIVASTADGAKDSGWKCAFKLFVGNDNKGLVSNARVI